MTIDLKNQPFCYDISCAVTFLRPILQSLNIKGECSEATVFLAQFSHLCFLKDIERWQITFIKTDLYESKAIFFSRFRKEENITQSYIMIDNSMFMNARTSHEIRKAVAVHKFCHFVALLYASTLSTSEDLLRSSLRERLSKLVYVLNDNSVLELYKILYKKDVEDFIQYELTSDSHFRLNCENMNISYSDLYRNFLLSKQLFDEYFNSSKRQQFLKFIKDGKIKDALNFYDAISKTIAKEKWLSDEFSIRQARSFIPDYLIS